MNPHSQLDAVRARTLSPSVSRSLSFLATLEAAHRRLEACIAELEFITTEVECREIATTGARMRIGVANLDKHCAVREACAHLLPLVQTQEADAIRRLREDNGRRVQLTSDHVRRWTAQAVADDWNLYCEAFRGIRINVKDGILAEKRLLYPLLERN